MMKIAILLKSFMGGGAERNLLVLARYLVDRGHQVSLIVFKNQGPLADKVDSRIQQYSLGIRTSMSGRILALRADPRGLTKLLRPILLPLKTDKTIRCLPDLVRVLRGIDPDAILAAMPYVNLEAVWGATLAKSRARVVVSERIEVSHYLKERSAWRYTHLLPLMARTYSRADAIVSVSSGVGDDLARATGLERDRITTVYNPVVTSDLLERASAPIDHPWFQAGALPVVVNIGRLSIQKDHATLLRAFARARSERQIRLVILGEGGSAEKTAQAQAALMEIARDLGVENDVQFLGFKENPYPYLTRASVFALSSRYEGLPTVLVEAMACGCPVVSTSCPGSVEILEGGKYGEITPIGDAEGLGQAILKALNSPVDKDALKQRSLDFSAEQSVEKYEDLLSGV